MIFTVNKQEIIDMVHGIAMELIIISLLIVKGNHLLFNWNFLSERAIYDFNWALINCICSERIPYQHSNFDCIPKDLLDMPTVRNFIAKLLKEQRIDASDKLVIRGYYIDQETN